MRGLKFRLVGLCTGMLVAFSSITSLLYVKALTGEKEGLIRSLEAVALNLQNGIGSQFYERYSDVQMFALNPVFQDKNIEAMQTAFDSYAKAYGIYDVMLFVDLNGKMIASNTITPQGQPVHDDHLQQRNFSDQAWFINASTGQTTDDKEKGFSGSYFQDLHINDDVKEAVNNDGYVTIFAAQVKDKRGNAIGVLANFANAIWIERQLMLTRSSAEKVNIAAIDLLLLGKDGVNLLVHRAGHNQPSRDFANDLLKKNLARDGDESAKQALLGKTGSGEMASMLNKPALVAAWAPVSNDSFIASIGWKVLVQVESDKFLLNIHRAIYSYFISGGLLLAVFSAAGFWFATTLVSRLHILAQGITKSGHSVNATSTDLAVASKQVSASSVAAATSLAQTVTSVEELTSMVELNNDHAAQAASLAQNSSHIATEGESEVNSLIISITELSQSSRKIESIISVINDIAFQTDLLALNAAVEAARAGEQGKGFAVVADAVRTLSQRSATAAKEISTLIRENVAKIDHGTKLADRSGKVLKEILVATRKVADISKEISAASKEQAIGISQISKAMNELDQATKRNAIASEQVAESSSLTKNQALALHELVAALSELINGKKNATTTHLTELTTRPVNDPISKTKAKTILLKREERVKNHPALTPIARTKNSTPKAEDIIPFEEQDQRANLDNISGF